MQKLTELLHPSKKELQIEVENLNEVIISEIPLAKRQHFTYILF